LFYSFSDGSHSGILILGVARIGSAYCYGGVVMCGGSYKAQRRLVVRAATGDSDVAPGRAGCTGHGC
jgi:hypothetical protein